MKSPLILILFISVVFLFSCTKETDMQNDLLDQQLTQLEDACNIAHHYNDSLMQCQQYQNCLDSGRHHDNMFHHCDSTFMHRNQNMQNCCNGGGGQMNGGKGGMMNNNQMQHQNHCDSMMQQLRQQHRQYCRKN